MKAYTEQEVIEIIEKVKIKCASCATVISEYTGVGNEDCEINSIIHHGVWKYQIYKPSIISWVKGSDFLT